MKISKLVFAVLFSSLLIGLSYASRPSLALEQAACPDSSAGEKEEDCPWAGVARTLVKQAESGQSVRNALSTLLPKLVSNIRIDGEKSDMKDLWGKSINFDEGAKAIIVHPAILEAIGELFGNTTPQSDSKIVHAGMEHTYGYLFSNLKTAYGYKRARWVQGEIDSGFGLPIGTLGPNPAAGSLFTNITIFTGNIAFNTESNEREVIRKNIRDTAPEIKRFHFEKLKPIRLEERVEVANKNGKVRTVKLRTDFVPFLNPGREGGNTHLLIYSVFDPFSHEAQLISAFPVQTSFVERAINPKDMGKKPVSTRYNAFVDGLSGTTVMGERKVVRGAVVPQLGE